MSSYKFMVEVEIVDDYVYPAVADPQDVIQTLTERLEGCPIKKSKNVGHKYGDILVGTGNYIKTAQVVIAE